MRTVETLLQSPLIHGDKQLQKIFHVVEVDEPSHWAPYELVEAQSGAEPRWNERIADKIVHATMLLIKLPALYLESVRTAAQRLARRHPTPEALAA